MAILDFKNPNCFSLGWTFSQFLCRNQNFTETLYFWLKLTKSVVRHKKRLLTLFIKSIICQCQFFFTGFYYLKFVLQWLPCMLTTHFTQNGFLTCEYFLHSFKIHSVHFIPTFICSVAFKNNISYIYSFKYSLFCSS